MIFTVMTKQFTCNFSATPQGAENKFHSLRSRMLPPINTEEQRIYLVQTESGNIVVYSVLNYFTAHAAVK